MIRAMARLAGNKTRRRLLRWACLAGVALLILAAIAAPFAEHGWVFDVFTHFRWHYFAAAIVLALASLVWTSRWLAFAALLAGASHIPAVVAAGDFTAPAAAREATALRLMTFNVWWPSGRLDGMLGRVKVAQPDVIVLQEVHGPWQRAIETLLHHYPHVAPADWRRSGIVILSRRPLTELRSGDFTVAVDVALEGRSIRLVGVHMPRPLSAALWRAQQGELANLAERARTAGMPFVAAGDFNLTPYSPRFRRFLAESRLRAASLGGVWPSTWPSATRWIYGGPLLRGIVIDHVLVSAEFGISYIYRGPDVGSDHYPEHVDLALPR